MENCPKYLCSQIGKAALRATRHNGYELVSQIGKNPQMKVVLIFLYVPVFSSVGWLSYVEHIIFLFSSFSFFPIICLQDSTVKVKL